MIETWLKQDLQSMVQVTPLGGNLFSADDEGNRIGVIVTDGGEEATLSGTVTGYVIRNDAQTVLVTGTLSGNRAYIDLPKACYIVPGQISIVIQVDEVTLAACTGYVYQARTDEMIDPGDVVPDISELLAKIGDCETATTAANTAATAANTAATNVATIVAPAFAEGTANAAGTYVTKDGKLYLLPNGHTANTTWANTTKTEVTAGGQLCDLKSAINGYSATINNAVGQRVIIQNMILSKNRTYTIKCIASDEVASSASISMVIGDVVTSLGTVGRYSTLVVEFKPSANTNEGILRAYCNSNGGTISAEVFETPLEPKLNEIKDHLGFADVSFIRTSTGSYDIIDGFKVKNGHTYKINILSDSESCKTGNIIVKYSDSTTQTINGSEIKQSADVTVHFTASQTDDVTIKATVSTGGTGTVRIIIFDITDQELNTIYSFEKKQSHVSNASVAFEQGGIDSATGLNVDSVKRIRSVDFIPFNYFYAINVNYGYKISVLLYDINKDYLTSTGFLNDGDSAYYTEIAAIYSAAYYVRILICKNDNGDITPSDASASGVVFETEHGEIFEEQETISWEIGGIDGTTGQTATRNDRVRTQRYIKLDELSIIKIPDNVMCNYFAYYIDSADNPLTKRKPLGNRGSFSSDDITPESVLSKYPTAKYIKLYIQGTSTSDASGIKFYKRISGNIAVLNTGLSELNEKMDTLYNVGTKIYYGERINLKNKYNDVLIGNPLLYQGGAIASDGKMFVFSDNGKFNVFNILTGSNAYTNCILGGSVIPHCNVAVFGTAKYDNDDPYPLIYVNGYNNDDVPLGSLYAHRLIIDNDTWTTELVQTILIGFTDAEIWTGTGQSNVYYGNFFIDTDNGYLYAYVNLQAEKVTRFFKFNMPGISSQSVTLNQSDIIETFDVDYIQTIQDNTYYQGKVYIVSGNNNAANPALINVVDLVRKKIVTIINLRQGGRSNEPESVSVYDEHLYYGNPQVYRLETY